mgnify:CR=1
MESFMNKVLTIFFAVFLISCGGGGGSQTPVPPGSPPSGNFSGQVDPVQTQE